MHSKHQFIYIFLSISHPDIMNPVNVLFFLLLCEIFLEASKWRVNKLLYLVASIVDIDN